MANPSFEISAVWDEAAQVWVSESDIIGLHIEAETLEDFEREVKAHAAELIVTNHLDKADLANQSLKDLIPTIFWRSSKPGETPA